MEGGESESGGIERMQRSGSKHGEFQRVSVKQAEAVVVKLWLRTADAYG